MFRTNIVKELLKFRNVEKIIKVVQYFFIPVGTLL